MAPLAIQAAGGSATKEFKNESGYARLLGSGRPCSVPTSAENNVVRICWRR